MGMASWRAVETLNRTPSTREEGASGVGDAPDGIICGDTWNPRTFQDYLLTSHHRPMAAPSPSPAPAGPDDRPLRLAAYPFNVPRTDVVFTTADGVEFRLFKNVLSIASPFFADMFSLAQPEGQAEVQLTEPGKPSNITPIPITESSCTFDSLLRFCYPVTDPVITSLPELELILDAARKYQMEEAINLAKRMLRQFVDGQPLRTFTLACRFGAEEESRLAAAAWKRFYEAKFKPPPPQKKASKTPPKPVRSRAPPLAYPDFATTLMCTGYIPEMADLPAAVYHRLMYYGRVNFESPPSFIHRDAVYPPPIPSAATPRDDVLEWPIAPADADIIVRSVDGVDFPFHTLLLKLSAVTSLIDAGTNMEPVDGTPPIAQVSVSSTVLKDLLNVCLPSAGCDIEDTYRLWRLSRVAIEYKMDPVIAAVKKQCQRKAATWPLSVYLIASQSGWAEDAASSARLLTEQVHIEDIYDPILEETPSAVYHALLRYHHHALAAMSRVMGKYTPARAEWKGRFTRYPDTWPVYVALPVAGQELERQMQRTTPNRGQRAFDILALMSESERMEKEVKDAVSGVRRFSAPLVLNTLTDLIVAFRSSWSCLRATGQDHPPPSLPRLLLAHLHLYPLTLVHPALLRPTNDPLLHPAFSQSRRIYRPTDPAPSVSPCPHGTLPLLRVSMYCSLFCLSLYRNPPMYYYAVSASNGADFHTSFVLNGHRDWPVLNTIA